MINGSVSESEIRVSGPFKKRHNADTKMRLTEKAILGETTDETVEKIKLSNRQRQMLDAIAKGMQYKEIAFKYGISENTVAFHISKLKDRLDCSNSREIISSALMLGLISAGEEE